MARNKVPYLVSMDEYEALYETAKDYGYDKVSEWVRIASMSYQGNKKHFGRLRLGKYQRKNEQMFVYLSKMEELVIDNKAKKCGVSRGHFMRTAGLYHRPSWEEQMKEGEK